MIVTLTAHPSIDRTISLEAPLAVGEVQRGRSSREDAGGKGVNVSRVVAAAATPTRAVVPVAADDPYREMLAAEKVPAILVPVAGRVRANLAVTDPAGTTTKINLPGATLDAEGGARLASAVVQACAGAQWLVLAGSLPPGAADDYYAFIIRAVRQRWGSAAPKIAVDASGAALRAVVDDGHPDLIKPNEDELAELVGEHVSGDEDPLLEAARRAGALVPARVDAALVTLGAAGAILVTADGVLVASPPRIDVVSTVGAGDSSLAGYLLADIAGAAASDRLRNAVAYGAAAASLPGTQAPNPGDLPRGAITVAPLNIHA